MKANYYEHSGKYAIVPLIGCFFAISFVIPLIAAIYSVITYHFPFILLVPVILYGCSKFLIYIIPFFYEICEIRNYTVYSRIGFFAGLLFLFSHWAIWMNTHLTKEHRKIENAKIENQELIKQLYWRGHDVRSLQGKTFDTVIVHSVSNFIASPKLLWSEIKKLNKEGRVFYFSYRGSKSDFTIKGFWLWLIWSIEAFILFFGVASPTKEEPFCEESERWATKKELLLHFAMIKEPDKFIKALEEKDYKIFKTLKVGFKKSSHSKIFFHYCQGSRQYYISIDSTEIKRDKGGHKEKNKAEILRYLEIDRLIAKKMIYSTEKLAKMMVEKKKKLA